MNKNFIPYKEAFELNELGFNEPCISKWEEDYICQDEGFDIQNDDTWITNKGLYYNDKYCSAPLYQQVFRWFRDKHNLIGLIMSNSEARYEFKIHRERILKSENHNTVHRQIGAIHEDNGNYNNTYEEAELSCLRKLIEIVKRK